jgi:hypothetical protein
MCSPKGKLKSAQQIRRDWSEKPLASGKKGRRSVIDAMEDPCSGLPFCMLIHLFTIQYFLKGGFRC